MKKIITLTLVLLLAVSLAVGISAADRKVVGKYNGEDGEISWKMYSDGELVISGDAAIPNFTGADADWMAYASEIEKVTIEDGVTAIGRCAFYGLIKLDEVSIPDTVESIGMQAFYRCIKLKKISIPGSVKTIGAEAFGTCSNLETVELGNGVENIRSNAFLKCKKLETITIPKSVETISAEAFKDCDLLREVYFRAATAPELGVDAFDGVDEDIFVIYVPKNSSGYTKGEWKAWYTETYTPEPDGTEDEEKLGDIDGDGRVKESDLDDLIAFLVGATDEINKKTADVDGDGKISIADSIYLARHLDGWKKYEL